MIICLNCTKGGQENGAGHLKRASNWHDKCQERDCVCQHKIGTGWVKSKDSKVPLMQTQSP